MSNKIFESESKSKSDTYFSCIWMSIFAECNLFIHSYAHCHIISLSHMASLPLCYLQFHLIIPEEVLCHNVFVKFSFNLHF